ncbi:hypothetical protein CFC21_041664 [Triticum aestivum]|uniref:dUTP diphosphatase n=3 Tax=Triticum aestivum TaxID=4565 RepID=A0A9R1FKC6_WHEAT|nr:hypothetical protein CFC21_041664 [Triticum aestivum]
MKGCMLFILQAPELFTQGGDPAFFTARGSVSHLFVRATRRGLALLHVSCNKDQPLAILLIRVHVLKRVIDADYRSLVGVVLFNHSEVDFTVKPDDRVAQMIVQVIVTPEVAEVEDLDTIIWGEKGLGSTSI